MDLELPVDILSEAKIKYSLPVVDLSLPVDKLSEAKIKYSLSVMDVALPVDRLKKNICRLQTHDFLIKQVIFFKLGFNKQKNASIS